MIDSNLSEPVTEQHTRAIASTGTKLKGARE